MANNGTGRIRTWIGAITLAVLIVGGAIKIFDSLVLANIKQNSKEIVKLKVSVSKIEIIAEDVKWMRDNWRTKK